MNAMYLRKAIKDKRDDTGSYFSYSSLFVICLPTVSHTFAAFPGLSSVLMKNWPSALLAVRQNLY